MDAAPSAPVGRLWSRPVQVAGMLLLVVAISLIGWRWLRLHTSARPSELASGATLAHQIDLNQADLTQLAQLPNIGPKLAEKIVAHRETHGPFATVDSLADVGGIGDATLRGVRPYVRVGRSEYLDQLVGGGEEEAMAVWDGQSSPEIVRLARKPPEPEAPTWDSGGAPAKFRPGDPPIDPNAASYAELLRLPGVGKVIAANIIAERDRHPFRSLADLDNVAGIGPATLEKIRPFVVIP